jgi:hypothetical protein
LLLQYKTDRAEFTRDILGELKVLFLNRRYSYPLSYEHEIAKLVQKLFSKHYPLSRGQLLYFLAKHLAHWPLIRSAIEGTLAKTRSVFVGNYREDIQNIFHEARNESQAAQH